MIEETNRIADTKTVSSNEKTVEISDAFVTFTRQSPRTTHVRIVPTDRAPRFANNYKIKEFLGAVFLNEGLVSFLRYTPRTPDEYKDKELMAWVVSLKQPILLEARDFNQQPDYIEACVTWEKVVEDILGYPVHDLSRNVESLHDTLDRFRPSEISRFGGAHYELNFSKMFLAEGRISGILSALTTLAGVYVNVEDVMRQVMQDAITEGSTR